MYNLHKRSLPSIRQSLAELVQVLREHSAWVLEREYRRRSFGVYGEAGYAALWKIQQILRETSKYGVSHESILALSTEGEQAGLVNIEDVKEAINMCIYENCPNFDEIYS